MDQLQTRLVEMWSDALGGEPVGVHDNFFELGGDSLLAADLLIDVYREFGVEVPAWVLFRHPTIAELAGEMLSLR